MSGISTHILDVHLGGPAAAVPVTLQQHSNGTWLDLSKHRTDADGRVKQLLPDDTPLSAGAYRIIFDTQTYFEARQLAGLYPTVEVHFMVREPAGHYHIPLLLTANGYSTYRGS